jgi:hypothetical protein
VKKVTAVIAGIGVSLISHDLPFKPSSDAAFLTDAGADITLTVHCEKRPSFHKKERIFDSGQTWALLRCKGKFVLQKGALVSDSPPDTFLVLEPGFRSGDLYLPDDLEIRADDPLPYPLNQLLMILLLSRGKGLLLHACGISDNGTGCLYAGNSGHGKSTMAKLWHEQGTLVLNDDRIVIREKDGVLWMYGTPWHGDFKEHSTGGLPIQKVFFLSQGNCNTVYPKHGAEAVSMLLTRSFPPLWDKEGMAFTMCFCHRLVEKIPCYELSFVPDSRVVDFVRSI